MLDHNPYLLAMHARIRQEQFLREAEAERLARLAESANDKKRPVYEWLRKLLARLRPVHIGRKGIQEYRSEAR